MSHHVLDDVGSLYVYDGFSAGGDDAPGGGAFSSGENWRKMLKFLKTAEKVVLFVRVRPRFEQK